MNGLEAMEKINGLAELLDERVKDYAKTGSTEALNKTTIIIKEIIELKEKLSKVTI